MSLSEDERKLGLRTPSILLIIKCFSRFGIFLLKSLKLWTILRVCVAIIIVVLLPEKLILIVPIPNYNSK